MILQGDYSPGTPLQDVLGDAVLDIDIIPNIARCASIIGVAREVAALTGQTLHEPEYDILQEGPSVEQMVRITTDDPAVYSGFAFGMGPERIAMLNMVLKIFVFLG